jgi:hypothetical protein
VALAGAAGECAGKDRYTRRHGGLPVGRFTDHGPHRLAEYVPRNRLTDRRRPDVIRRLLSAGSQAKALREAPR